jgi:hypothetical protein
MFNFLFLVSKYFVVAVRLVMLANPYLSNPLFYNKYYVKNVALLQSNLSNVKTSSNHYFLAFFLCTHCQK